MNKYRVLVTETYQKAIIVRARNESEAHRRASDAWQNGEYCMGDNDFEGTEFYVQEKADDAENGDLIVIDKKEV